MVMANFETDSKMHIEVAKEFIGSILLPEIIVIFERINYSFIIQAIQNILRLHWRCNEMGST